MEDGARIAIRTAREAAIAPIAEVRFVLFDERAYQAFAEQVA
jgi:hypothetical protein